MYCINPYIWGNAIIHELYVTLSFPSYRTFELSIENCQPKLVQNSLMIEFDSFHATYSYGADLNCRII